MTRGEWKREVHTTQQQEAKRLGIEPCFLCGRETSERLPTHGAALGKHECSLSLVKHWPDFRRALPLEFGRRWALPTNSWSGTVIFEVWVLWVSTLDVETVLLQESHARLSRLEAQEVATPPTGGHGTWCTFVNLQMVNWLQAERDALSQELRRNRAPKGKTSWLAMHHQI